MTLVVPAVLGGLAIAVMLLVSMVSSRLAARRHRRNKQVAIAGPRILIHSINDDRCTGCDACVAVCPTNVLDLVENKSRVLRFEDCIQCEACMWACPTTALVMHPDNVLPPPYKSPELDENYQTMVPGQYLIGEVAGKPLVKNAANLGRAVVEHMLRSGLRASRKVESGGMTRVDVAIIGSGPGGLSAALTCIQRGLSYVVLEKENIISSTVSRYPKGKLVMAEPYDTANLSMLPVFDSSKEELVPIWRDLIARVGMEIKMGETVEQAVRGADGWFDVRSNVAAYKAARVVLATGTRGKPRTLGVTGENLPKVFNLLEDPEIHAGQAVAVVGGGDSALEAAIALADAGARVILSYRGKSFSRAQPKNRQTIEQYEAERRIKVKYESEVIEIAGDTLTLQMRDGTQKRYPNEAMFVLIGADPPIEWLAKMGIRFIERPHMFALPKSDELVRRYVRDAVACPDTAAGAAAVLQGRPLVEEPRAESRAKKFIRSATGMLGNNGRLDKPMPLSEFAAQRRHDGRGRRDQLEPRERTRVLRMLRDEGGRLAEEDSKLYVIDRARSERSDVAIVPHGSPPPAPTRVVARKLPLGSAPPPVPAAGAPSAADLLTTLPPGRHTSPFKSSDDSSAPRPAIVVGLARAAQTQPPRGGASRKRPGGGAAIFDEPTREVGPDLAAELLRRQAAQSGQSGKVAHPDDPTSFTDVNEFRTEPKHAFVSRMEPHEEATHQVDLNRRGGRPRAPTRLDADGQTALAEIDWELD